MARCAKSAPPRCHRLNKECIPSPSAAKRPRTRHRASRSARLEEKLDDLVSLLRNREPTSRNQTADLSVSEADEEETSILTPPLTTERNNASSTAPFDLEPSPASIISLGDELWPLEGEEALKRFQEEIIASPLLEEECHTMAS